MAAMPVKLSHPRLWGALAFAVLLFLTVELTGLRGNFSLAYVREVFLAHQLIGISIFVALFSLGNLIHVPGLVFLVAAVLSLGQVWGGLVTYLAAFVSSLVTFLVYRWIGGDALTQLKGRFALRILKSLHARPIRSAFLLRTLMQTLPALNISLAMTGIRLRHYVLGTLLGLPLPIALFCVFFDVFVKGLQSL